MAKTEIPSSSSRSTIVVIDIAAVAARESRAPHRSAVQRRAPELEQQSLLRVLPGAAIGRLHLTLSMNCRLVVEVFALVGVRRGLRQ